MQLVLHKECAVALDSRLLFQSEFDGADLVLDVFIVLWKVEHLT